MLHNSNTSVHTKTWWSMHTHSKFSANDALSSVESIVERANELSYPALGLTDHGTPSGLITLYKECRKVGIEPLPGIELYVVPDAAYAGQGDSMHLTMVAYTEEGYRNLCKVVTTTAKQFYYKPRIDFADFAAMASEGATAGLAVASGCYFGVLPQALMKRGSKAARQIAETLAGWFPHVYIEVQNHGIKADEHKSELELSDDELNEALYALAQESGLPMVATRDSHYVHESQQKLHDGLKQLVSWSDDPDDAKFPGGGYHMTDYEGMTKYMDTRYLDAGMEGLDELARLASVRLPELEQFSLKVPDVVPGRDPQTVLEDTVLETIKEIAPPKHMSEYLDRATSELNVIRRQGMAQYLLLVDQVCQFMVERNISFHTRGSASGSICTWALGITQLDPIRFGLRFDRFLSSNRLKPPDVDLDVEHERRDEVIAYLISRWSIRSIGSHMKYSLFEDQDEEHGRGSLRVRYFSTMRKKGTPVDNWRDIPRKDRDQLQALADLGLYSGFGRHAAGFIVAPDESTVSQLPMVWIASSSHMVTGYGKKDVEKLGFLKLDLLGLRTRTAIRIAEELSGVVFEDIPLNDRPTFTAISTGNNLGVFQLEGKTMAHGCKQIKPKRIEDVIAIQALFRPATMSSSATQDFKERRNKMQEVPNRHPDILSATQETFGVMLYQEQVMQVMENLGMTPAELEEMLDAVKASNEYSAGAAVVIEAMMPRIKDLAQVRGWGQADIDWMVKSLSSYAEYSFNKAHAASYGVVAYSTAYMRKHYPAEFWTGMLIAFSNHDKELLYVKAARDDGIEIKNPDINRSGITYKMEGHAIRKGFLSVKGVGTVAAAELATKSPFASLDDLAERVVPRKVSGSRLLALGKWPDECGGIIGHLEAARVLDTIDWADKEDDGENYTGSLFAETQGGPSTEDD